MYITIHAAIGAAAAAAVTKDPVAAFGLGWFLHYVADLVPHGDEAAGEWCRRGRSEVRRYALLAGIDGLALAGLLGVDYWRHGLNLVVLAAAAGSVLPDAMWGLETVVGKKLFGPFQRFHSYVHNHFRIRLPWPAGLLLQGGLAAILWWCLIR